jgi:glycosyltransferase involved in cell wall biosynthesis
MRARRECPPRRERQRDRTVLMVLYHFPPVGGVSMSRNVRNVQHLPHHGWVPIVLTPSRVAGGLGDPGALGLVPEGADVIRTKIIEAGHLRVIALRLRDLAGSPRRIHVGRRHPVSTGAAEALGSAIEVPGGTRPIGLGHLRPLLFFPDDQVGWLPFALVAAIRRHRRTPFDAVYSTSSPVTAHLVAGMVKRLTGIPWVVELRDPWMGNALAARLPWPHRRLQFKLERWIVGSADRVVCVSPSMTRLYQRRYPWATVVTIPNGYDQSETLTPSAQAAGSQRFRIVYTGTLDRPAELQIFLEGLDALVVRRPDLHDTIEVAFYGWVSDACRAIADTYVAGRLGSILRFEGFVPRSVALRVVADADAALILLGAGPGMDLFVGGKLYDYLGQNRQILAMLPDGDARDLLDGLGWGVVASPDPAQVANAIERLLSLPTPVGRPDPDGMYDRAVLAGRLADILDAAVAASSISEAVNR